MYAKGITTRQLYETIEDIYGFEVSESFVSDVTDKILPQIEEWQNRPVSEVYPIVFIDAIHYHVRKNNLTVKKAVYIVLGITHDGLKEVITIEIGGNESSKFWLSVFNNLKNRGVRDIFVVCADGLAGIKEAIEAAYPQAKYQRCIVHQVRNTLRYVSYKDYKSFSNDLKKIYHAPNEELALKALDEVSECWKEKYPQAMKSWYTNWDALSPIFKFTEMIILDNYCINKLIITGK